MTASYSNLFTLDLYSRVGVGVLGWLFPMLGLLVVGAGFTAWTSHWAVVPLTVTAEVQGWWEEEL